jgi:N-acetylneuraminic acid mutarotase
MKKQILLLTMIIIYCVGARIVYSQGECWLKRKNMSVARALMPAVVLNDTIYVIGGSLSGYTSTSIVEAYDAATDSWTPKASLPQKLCGETASSVNDKIYVIGGSTSISGTGYAVDSVYEYDPVSNSWTSKSNIPTALMAAAADVVDGKIYVIGGAPFGMNSAYKSVYEYNPATDAWTKKSDMPTARCLASATAVDGKIYVFGGGTSAYGTGLFAVEVYDPSADTWAVKGPMPIPRATHASSAVNGNIYIFTGALRVGTIYNDVLEYNPILVTWETRTSIPTPRVSPAACSIGGKTYIIGGMNISNTRLSTVEEYNPALDITSVGESNNVSLPMEYSLYQNYPNPFNPTTTISYSNPSTSHVRLAVYDIMGQEVAVLTNEVQKAGIYNARFSGANLASGVYFYRLSTENSTLIKRMVLAK